MVAEYKDTTESKVLKALGQLRSALKELGATDAEPIMEVIFGSSEAYDLVRKHMIENCHANDGSNGEESTNSIVWSRIRLAPLKPLDYTEHYNWISENDVNSQFSGHVVPVVGDYLYGNRIGRVVHKEAEVDMPAGWEVYTMRKRNQFGSLHFNRLDDLTDFIAAPSAIATPAPTSAADRAPGWMPVDYADQGDIDRLVRVFRQIGDATADASPVDDAPPRPQADQP